MTQFGMYSQTTPRNDASPARGQWNLDDAYRYVSEAYGGYHWDRLHGINVDAGIFMSYVGLWSYYQFDNWSYQPSYVSSNTPWFFNGAADPDLPERQAEDRAVDRQRLAVVREVQQGSRRRRAGALAAERLGVDRRPTTTGAPTRSATPIASVHTDDSIQVKYSTRPDAKVTKAAFTFTFDAGCEYGGGVSCGGGTGETPSQTSSASWPTTASGSRGHAARSPSAAARSPTRAATWCWCRPINGATACFGHAVLHREPGRRVHRLGRLGDVRLHAEPVRDVPFRGQLTGRPTCRTSRAGRRDAARRQHRGAGFGRAGLRAGPAGSRRTALTVALLVKF